MVFMMPIPFVRLEDVLDAKNILPNVVNVPLDFIYQKETVIHVHMITAKFVPIAFQTVQHALMDIIYHLKIPVSPVKKTAQNVQSLLALDALVVILLQGQAAFNVMIIVTIVHLFLNAKSVQLDLLYHHLVHVQNVPQDALVAKEKILDNVLYHVIRDSMKKKENAQDAQMVVQAAALHQHAVNAFMAINYPIISVLKYVNSLVEHVPQQTMNNVYLAIKAINLMAILA